MKLCNAFLLTLAVSGICALSPVRAQEHEAPPIVSARSVLGDRVSGANYRIEDQVSSDGFLRIYTITTNYGRFEAQGYEMLRVRLNELNALASLQKMNESEIFTNAVTKAGLAPIKFAGDLILNPVGTINQTLTGVGTAFARIGEIGQDAGSGSDRMTGDSAFGVSSAKRQLAAGLGVDPYTDFKPLADKLDSLARVAAAGNLTISAAFMAISGGVGMAVSSSRTANDLGQLMADKTPIELRDINRGKLGRMGVPEKAAKAFLGNRAFTPLDETIIVGSLDQMRGVKNRQLFIQRGSNIVGRDMVFFLRKRAELTAEYHNKVEPFAEFVDASGVPLSVTKSGRVVAIFPLDGLSWTDTTDRAFRAIDRELKKKNLGKNVEIRLTGTTTDSVREGARARGWKLVENVN